jgi:anthranilate synthase component 2
MTTVFLIDNLDSFTFNLVDSLVAQRLDVRVFRNTTPAARLMEQALAVPSAVFLLSPGPGGPADAGCCLELVRRARGLVGVVGVCLGHQVLLAAGGIRVERAPRPVHGEAAALDHDGTGPFADLPNPLRVGRYHSLGAPQAPLDFVVHASLDGVVYAMSSRQHRAVGLQFHPESILTPQGDRLLARSLAFVDRSATSTATPTQELSP